MLTTVSPTVTTVIKQVKTTKAAMQQTKGVKYFMGAGEQQQPVKPEVIISPR